MLMLQTTFQVHPMATPPHKLVYVIELEDFLIVSRALVTGEFKTLFENNEKKDSKTAAMVGKEMEDLVVRIADELFHYSDVEVRLQ